MNIKILPARLANQIAAGEVVERPASVVKELVENSLDSGATRIDIDIEKGGSKLIRVRDNGKGIVKDELALALSRHATSKIHTLDDLEAIMSLGFRGEALASISSVSRLTLTSRTATQEQAWEAYSEGREMDVQLKPSAHPIGTSVDVLDLFFNTPARRKFLRTEKTEFTHIDELLKRIALSRFDVTINLRHNGKVVRQYRSAKNQLQSEKRIAAVCGTAFVKSMLSIYLEHNGMKLHGWITSPEGARQQSDLQYCYVNGRMMKDKLINHAIRQSYQMSLKPDQFAAYVLFIELDPHQVDVNVHPAKHEVRFHQTRLVHDFIYQALTDALAQSQHVDKPKTSHSAFKSDIDNLPSQDKSQISSLVDMVSKREADAIENIPAYPGRKDYEERPEFKSDDIAMDKAFSQPATRAEKGVSPSVGKQEDSVKKYRMSESTMGTKPTSQELKIYSDLLTTPKMDTQENPIEYKVATNTPDKVISKLGKVVSVVDNQYLLMQSDNGVVLVSLKQAEWYRVLGQLQTAQNALKVQPLLVPLSIKIGKEAVNGLKIHQRLLDKFAIQLKQKNADTIMVMGVPQPLRKTNLQQIVSDLLVFLNELETDKHEMALASWLAYQVFEIKNDYALSEGIQIITELEQLWQGVLPLTDKQFVQAVNFETTIAKLNIG